ncbi:hypothetical protein FJ955_02030 [Mesorhizobium sp. B2-2-2]|uniref:hypothetical protein n=1 Tax=Mesorhizobium sp. B2-2-2 TaxID=2589964 RepID=UPI00112C848C|nr:hypothetical protein [Mesorhizobium sp. B2-2-2]TPM33550.1 hypothetical protein FJ955_02030 [Mesorhizobium sp. B2-2-2]
MFKRILLSTLAAGTVLAGVNVAAAEGDRFVFRYKGGVIQLAAATPEEPEVPAAEPKTIGTFTFSDGWSFECEIDESIAAGDPIAGDMSLLLNNSGGYGYDYGTPGDWVVYINDRDGGSYPFFGFQSGETWGRYCGVGSSVQVLATGPTEGFLEPIALTSYSTRVE